MSFKQLFLKKTKASKTLVQLLVQAKQRERRQLRECQTLNWDVQHPCEEGVVIPVFTDRELFQV